MPTLTQIQSDFDAKQAEAFAFYDSFPKVDGKPDMKADDVEKFNKMTDDLNAVGEELDKFKRAEGNRRDLEARRSGAEAHDASKPLFGSGRDDQQADQRKALRKDIGDQFIEGAEYKAVKEKGFQGRFVVSEEIDAPSFKATLDRTGLTGYDRASGIVMVGTERMTIADLLAQAQTTQPTIRYLRETSYTNAATTVAEGALKPEATFALAEVDAPVKKIGVIAKVTDEMFADFPQVRDYVNGRLRFMVEEREEAQIINGNGAGANITGILQTAGIQTQAKGADPTPDAVYKAMNKVRTVGFFEPDGVVFHPNDWQDIRLLRTTDGLYIWGNPSEAGPERIWGKPIVQTTGMVENTALVGAFRLGAQLFRRMGVTIEATNSNEDDFKYNRVALRAEERIALAVYRALAFCTVTGI